VGRLILTKEREGGGIGAGGARGSKLSNSSFLSKEKFAYIQSGVSGGFRGGEETLFSGEDEELAVGR